MSTKETIDSEIVLQYCPFCGGTPEFRVSGNYNRKLDRRVGVKIVCTECKMSTATKEGFDAKERVTTHWNKRAKE